MWFFEIKIDRKELFFFGNTAGTKQEFNITGNRYKYLCAIIRQHTGWLQTWNILLVGHLTITNLKPLKLILQKSLTERNKIGTKGANT